MRIQEKKNKFYIASGYLWWKKVYRVFPSLKTAQRKLKEISK